MPDDIDSTKRKKLAAAIAVLFVIIPLITYIVLNIGVEARIVPGQLALLEGSPPYLLRAELVPPLGQQWITNSLSDVQWQWSSTDSRVVPVSSQSGPDATLSITQSGEVSIDVLAEVDVLLWTFLYADSLFVRVHAVGSVSLEEGDTFVVVDSATEFVMHATVFDEENNPIPINAYGDQLVWHCEHGNCQEGASPDNEAHFTATYPSGACPQGWVEVEAGSESDQIWLTIAQEGGECAPPPSGIGMNIVYPQELEDTVDVE